MTTTDRSFFEDRVEMLLANRGWPTVDSDGFRALDEHQKRMAALFILENEVSHGGFSKAYFNQTFSLGEHAADGYEAIGANEHAKVVRRSVEAAKKADASDRAKGGMMETMSEAHIKSGFAAVDSEWAALSKTDTSSQKAKYMQQHAKSFGIVRTQGA